MILHAVVAATQAAHRLPLRGIAGQVLMDRHGPDPLLNRRTGDLARLAPSQRGRLALSVNPRFAVACTDQLLARAAGLIRHRLRKQRIEIRERYGAVPSLLLDTDLFTQVFLNLLINAKSGVSWGTTSRHGPYFKDNTVANNIIYARDWEFCSGLPWGEGLAIEKNNLCVGPAIVDGKNKNAPQGVLCSRNKGPFVKEDIFFRDVMPPSVPGLVGEEEIGEEIEISRADFAVSEDYVRAATQECGFDEAEYKE